MSQDEILCSISFDELLYDRCIEHAKAIDYRLEHEMLDAVEDRLNKQGWFKERTCKPVYPNDSDYREMEIARCSNCKRPIMYYELADRLANYCHYCGCKVVNE